MRLVLPITSVSYSRRSTIAVRLALILLALSTSGAALHADLVRLTSERTVRVVAMSVTGDQATLELLSGGTMTVSKTSILAMEAEPFSPELCQASPYRCQDRAMLSRMMRAAALASAQPADNATVAR